MLISNIPSVPAFLIVHGLLLPLLEVTISVSLNVLGYVIAATFYAADSLWDGEGCGALEEDCCAAPGLPWFHKVFDAPTSDYIQMRLCTEQDSSDENVLLSSYEIYVL